MRKTGSSAMRSEQDVRTTMMARIRQDKAPSSDIYNAFWAFGEGLHQAGKGHTMGAGKERAMGLHMVDGTLASKKLVPQVAVM
jgi:hypothetical protein